MKRGFTLVETLITIVMVSMVFGLFMLLLRDSFQIARRMSSKDEARRAAQVGLDRMLTEARESYRWLAPNPLSQVDESTASDRLDVYKVNADDATRCPLAPPSYPVPQAFLWWFAPPAAAAAWNPQQDAHSQHVVYRILNGGLMRETGSVGAPTTANPLVLATGLSGLKCWSEPGQLLVVLLSYPEGHVIQRISGKVVCPGVERN